MRATRWFPGALVAGFVIVGGWAFAHRTTESIYRFASLDRGDIRSTVSATGTCSAVVTVQVGSQVSGNIKALHADFNSRVTRGQVVAEIDPEPFVARRNQAAATLASAQASVGTAAATAVKIKADIASAQAQTISLNADVAKAVAAENDARLKLDRRRTLNREAILAKEDLETAQANYDSAVAARQAAEAQVHASEASVHSLEGQLQVAEAQIQMAKAQVQQAAAALEQSTLDLSHTRITAPVDGVVISRNVDVGQTVAASFQAPVLFVIAQDLRQMQVDTSVDEADIGRVRVGQEASFTVDAFPNRVFHARVLQIREAPITAQNVVTYDVVLGLSNDDLKLLPGMTANVKIATEQRLDVLRVPNAALRFRPSTDAGLPSPGRIYVAGARDQLRAVRVKTGLSDGAFTELLSSELEPGDRVVLAEVRSANRPAAARPQRRGPGF